MPTIKNDVKIKGHGVHSGKNAVLKIHPSDVKGIFFRRVDMKNSEKIEARFDNVGDTTMRNTTIGNKNGPHVQTIEHLMAALFIAGVDSAVIDIDGPETPIMDGSAYELVRAIIKGGVKRGKMKKIVVKKTVVAHAKEILKQLPLGVRLKLWFFNKLAGRKTDGYVELSPNDGVGLNITATLVYPEKIIGSQTYSYKFDGKKQSVDDFIKNISQARTFGKYSEWDYLKAHGMARGANEHNVIALNDKGDGVLNNLIWPDEFVRHKIIDAIGDMFTGGGFVIGNLTSYKGSHALNNLVLKKLFSNPENYDIIDAK